MKKLIKHVRHQILHLLQPLIKIQKSDPEEKQSLLQYKRHAQEQQPPKKGQHGNQDNQQWQQTRKQDLVGNTISCNIMKRTDTTDTF